MVGGSLVPCQYIETNEDHAEIMPPLFLTLAPTPLKRIGLLVSLELEFEEQLSLM